MALELTAESIDRDILTELQAAGANGVLAQALAAFIHHTAERRDRDGDDLRAERDRIREELSMRPGHRRTAGMAADLLVGIERLIEFAIAVEVLTSEAGESFAGAVGRGDRPRGRAPAPPPGRRRAD